MPHPAIFVSSSTPSVWASRQATRHLIDERHAELLTGPDHMLCRSRSSATLGTPKRAHSPAGEAAWDWRPPAVPGASAGSPSKEGMAGQPSCCCLGSLSSSCRRLTSTQWRAAWRQLDGSADRQWRASGHGSCILVIARDLPGKACGTACPAA